MVSLELVYIYMYVYQMGRCFPGQVISSFCLKSMCFFLGAIPDSDSFQRNDHYVATSLVQTSLVNLFGSGMISCCHV